jgi:D-3-phosphoglycerate dehydrogenase
MAEREKKLVFVADPLSGEALERLEGVDGLEVLNAPGLARPEALEIAARAHGIIVRSQTQIDAEFLAGCARLEVVVRAGVGVDNIDVEAATRRGVVVQNVPEGNTRSAAEHTIAMMTALARNVPQAVASMRAGEWDRKSFVGTELLGKTLGVVGLGKIGRQVAHMATGLGMKIVGFDPFIAPQMSDELGIALAPSIDELIAGVDFLTLHVPLSPQTRDLVSAAVLAKARRGLFLINCARGGIVDEMGLLAALESGAVQGAALDVFAKEPPEYPELVRHPRVIATPHLGASTREAQLNVATASAQQMIDYFIEGRLTSPVNATAFAPEFLRGVEPYKELAFRLGVLQSQLGEGNPARVRLRFHGDLFDAELERYLTSATLCGFLQDRCSQPVNPVNARHLAAEMGLVVEEVAEGRSRYFHQMIRVEVESAGGARRVAGTIRGQKGLRLVALDDYHFDAVLEGTLLIIQNEDRPGMIGVIGNILAQRDVNISYMSLGRDRSGGTAIALLNLDEPVPRAIVEDLEAQPGIRWARLTKVPR